MRLGISAQFPHASCEEWGRKHREAGLGAVVFPLDYTAAVKDIDAYALCAKENDLVIAEVGAWSNPIDPDPEKRKKNRNLYNEFNNLDYMINTLKLINPLIIGTSFIITSSSLRLFGFSREANL